MKDRRSGGGWDVAGALAVLRARIDPYLWEQGQELYRRGAVEDFEALANGTIQVKVLDPRDSRRFFVAIAKDRDGRITARCPCPYRFEGSCRHQVVALEYLHAIADGRTPGAAPAPAEGAPAPESTAVPPPAPAGPALHRLFRAPTGVKTRPDGSLLRVALHSLGSLEAPHKLALQLYTGTGWTDLRTPEVGRWIAREAAGPHARDARIAALLAAGGELRLQVDSEVLASMLHALAGTDALVDRAGRSLPVSPWPWRLAARIARGGEGGAAVEFSCRSPEGDARAFDEVSLVPAAAPWIQLEDGAFHPLVAGAPGPLLAALQLEDHSAFTGADLDRLLAEGMEDLERLCPGSFEVEAGFIEEVEGVDAARVRLQGTPERLVGQLELSYGGEWVPAPASPEPWTVERGGKITRYPPAGASITRAERELAAAGLRRVEEGWAAEGPGALAKALAPRREAFVRLELPPALEALDLVSRPPRLEVVVSAAGAAGEALDPAEPAVRGVGAADRGPVPPAAGAQRGRSGIAWLEVSCRLTDGGREIPIDLERLEAERERDPQGLVQLADGTVIGLQHGAVRSLLELQAAARELGGSPATGAGSRAALRVPSAMVGEFLEERPERTVTLAGAVRGFAESLAAGGEHGEAPLDPRAAELLRPYQKEALQWFGLLARWGLGGLLADEMGLGKTVMALAHFFGRGAGEEAAARLPVLVIAPSSLVFNWLDECRRFFPAVEAVGLHGQAPAAREAAIARGGDLLVTSYALLRRDREALEAREFRAVLLDEAQHIKNAASQTSQAAFALRARERWILTGTPIENHLGELWSLFHFLLPGLLGAEAKFREQFGDPIAHGDEEALARLRSRVRPFLLRRTKAEVLPDLPPLIEQLVRTPMTPAQARLYDAYLARAREDLAAADPAGSRFQILAALTRLRQIACHPRLVLEPEEAQALGADPAELAGGKFELLREILDECLEEGHRVLLYSQFTSMLDLIEERLEELGVPRARLDGSTRDREGVVRRFRRDPAIPVFLISLKAGGFGLNLTEADTVILYDPWWNPAAEDQAAARAHRSGQTLPVHVHKLIATGTVEEKIVELQARKRDLAGQVVRAGEEPLEALGAEELKGLLFG